MKLPRLFRLSLLWQIMLSTSIALTVLFAVTGWVVQDQFVRSASRTLEDEVRGSFAAYKSLWQARVRHLASVSLVLSRMSDVRAAFGTRDRATIRDTAGEIWDKISQEDAVFLVADPKGAVIASLGGTPGADIRDLEVVRMAETRFPDQATGFLLQGGRLYQTVVTPVYVAATRGSALLNVLVAGYDVDSGVAETLKSATGGSDFVFVASGRVIASTLGAIDLRSLAPAPSAGNELQHVRIAGAEYSQFTTPLTGLDGRTIGELHILRSFELARRRIAALRANMFAVWLVAVLAGLLLTYVLARRILKPVRALDRAAAEIARGNYDARVESQGQDELGRLAQTFNGMCESLKTARDELIRQERISTISRLSTSIVHDLRNPLAAIYGGSEMLVDSELPPQQVKRLAANIYRSSRRVQELLSDLSDLTRGRTQTAEMCRLRDVVEAAHQTVAPMAETSHVGIHVDLPPDLELPLERSRIERVFENLFVNAIEAMPEGGTVRVSASVSDREVLVRVEDNGPGIPREILPRIFQPFASAGKRNGMGLGLALSRQAVLDHAGDIVVEPRPGPGTCFLLRLPR